MAVLGIVLPLLAQIAQVVVTLALWGDMVQLCRATLALSCALNALHVALVRPDGTRLSASPAVECWLVAHGVVACMLAGVAFTNGVTLAAVTALFSLPHVLQAGVVWRARRWAQELQSGFGTLQRPLLAFDPMARHRRLVTAMMALCLPTAWARLAFGPPGPLLPDGMADGVDGAADDGRGGGYLGTVTPVTDPVCLAGAVLLLTVPVACAPPRTPMAWGLGGVMVLVLLGSAAAVPLAGSELSAECALWLLAGVALTVAGCVAMLSLCGASSVRALRMTEAGRLDAGAGHIQCAANVKMIWSLVLAGVLVFLGANCSARHSSVLLVTMAVFVWTGALVGGCSPAQQAHRDGPWILVWILLCAWGVGDVLASPAVDVPNAVFVMSIITPGLVAIGTGIGEACIATAARQRRQKQAARLRDATTWSVTAVLDGGNLDATAASVTTYKALAAQPPMTTGVSVGMHSSC